MPAAALMLSAILPGAAPPGGDGEAVQIIFDTDLGNDCDDVLALGMLHALADRGECELLAVTTSKARPLSAPLADALNTFYGRPDVPVGACSVGGVLDGPTAESDGKYLELADERADGGYVYPHDVSHDPAEVPDAVPVLREVLAAAADGSVVIVQVGFSTNLARLLDSPGDDVSELGGTELVKAKVRRLVVMAGTFRPIRGDSGHLYTHREYNVVQDVPACQKLAAAWPTPVVWSGFEIGRAVPYPAESIDHDFAYAARHPLPESYQLYKPTPHERPTWDLTAAIEAVRPGRYFEQSPAGRVAVRDDGTTDFLPDPDGPHRYLILRPGAAERLRGEFAALCSQPPR